MRRLGRAFDALCLAVAGAATVAMVALVVLAVAMRYGFGDPLVYSHDLSVILFAWAVFAGLGLAERRGAHLSVDLIDRALPPRAARALLVVRQLAMAALSIWFAWLGWKLVQRAGMTIPSLRISVAWLYAAMPLGFAALAAGQILRLLDPEPRREAAA